MYTHVYPFTAIVGQEHLKLALLLNAINPAIGGVLIRGEKGTAKSTAVRALTALLPEIDVVRGCPYGCNPGKPQFLCDRCRSHDGPLPAGRRRVRVVTLPLNATEDRVAGGIDFNLAIRKGVRVLQPGLLAEAHRGILYVDEVNLLDDHIVDIILDTAASGRNVIEREGISFAHSARFLPVGTMNPEEGELRPQFLDRFGLCVEVVSEKKLERRTQLMERREAFDADPDGFTACYKEESRRVSEKIRTARKLLSGVVLSGHLRRMISDLCVESHVAGHRADLVMVQAARALAAFRGRWEATEEDVREVAWLALSHRKREPQPPPPPPPDDHKHENSHEHEDPQEEETPREEQPQQTLRQELKEGREESPEERDVPEEEEDRDADSNENKEARANAIMEQIFDAGDTFKVRKFSSPKDRTFRRGSGRRSRTRVSQKQGRYVKSALNRDTGDIALDATLRAAAPYQLRRKNGNGLAVALTADDIREKIREKRIGNFLLFVVDASGSMGARGRMVASKGAVMSLLLDAYQKRDKVAMVSFRKDEAVVNLPPTSSIELAAGLLKKMPVGGRTPLSAGLAKSYEILRNHLLREPTARPIAIVITDGKSNASMGAAKPVPEALAFAERIAMETRIRFIVVDTESRGLIRFGLARQLAGAMNAEYFRIEDLKADSLLNIVKGEL